MKHSIIFTIILSLLLSACEATRNAETDITFTVSVNDLTDHYVDVQMDCSNLQGEELLLKLPVWAPGYYIILDYPKNIIDFAAVDRDGNSLSWCKECKNGWKVSTCGASEITVTYRVWADAQSVAEACLTEDHLFLPGNGVFMYPDGGIGSPSTIKFVGRPEWSRIESGLQRLADNSDTAVFRAANFDILYDSPFFWGNPEVRSFDFEGHHYDVSLQGGLAHGLDSLCADIRKIIHAATDLMGDVPYENYTFLFLGPGRGGLEHWNSQADFLDGSRLDDYNETLSFIAHEYFHLYNVKALHPVELGPFDYDRECYTNCLWFSEGATVYYEYYLCWKAGLITRQQMLDCLASDFKVFESRDGKNHMTLARSSYDIWLNFFNFAGNGGDTRISYYEKGPAVTLLFDSAIRSFSNGARSFDDVMRLMYNRYYKTLGRGFTEDELNSAIREVAAPSTEDQRARLEEIFGYIYTTAPIDYNRFIEPAGLHWDSVSYTLR